MTDDREGPGGLEPKAQTDAELSAADLDVGGRWQVDGCAVITEKDARAVVGLEHVVDVHAGIDAGCVSRLLVCGRVQVLGAGRNSRTQDVLLDAEERRADIRGDFDL